MKRHVREFLDNALNNIDPDDILTYMVEFYASISEDKMLLESDELGERMLAESAHMAAQHIATAQQLMRHGM